MFTWKKYLLGFVSLYFSLSLIQSGRPVKMVNQFSFFSRRYMYDGLSYFPMCRINATFFLCCSSVGLVFIFGSLICLLVWVTYLPGAPMEQLLCKNLRDPEYTIFSDVSTCT